MSEPSASSLSDQIAEPTSEQTNMQIAFAAVLAARRETFLAHYPRKFKLAATALILALLVWGLWPSDTLTHEPVAALHEAEAQPSSGEAQAPSVATALHEKEKTQAEGALPVRVVAFQNEAEKEAAASNDNPDVAASLSVAPDAALIENLPSGALPKVSEDGRKPWQVYARPFDHRDPRPRVVLVLGDLGLSRVATDAALRRLPASVTLAFDVQAPVVKEWLDRARQDGHEVLLSLPMEPSDFPRSDPGPDSLLTTLPNGDNLHRFLSFLQMGSGYVGVTTMTGSRFATEPVKISPILDVLRQRGLLFLDAHITPHSAFETIAREMKVPVAVASRMIDANPTPVSIDEALSQLEQTARVEGVAIGIASPLPVTLERIELWSKQLAERGLVLAPLSAVVK